MALFITVRILMLLLAVNFRHAVHLSYGDISIEKNVLHGEITFYKDDWERSVARWYGHALPVSPQRQALYTQYLKAHLRLWSNEWSRPIAVDVTPKLDSGLSIGYSYSCRLPEGTLTLILDSRAVFSEYADQMNLMTIKTANKSENIIFTREKPTATIAL